MFQFFHIFIIYLHLAILSYITISRHDLALSFISIYYWTSLLTSNY